LKYTILLFTTLFYLGCNNAEPKGNAKSKAENYYSLARDYLHKDNDSTHIYLDSMYMLVSADDSPELYAKGLIVRTNGYFLQGKRVKNDSVISLMQDFFTSHDIKDLELFARFAIANQLKANENYYGADQEYQKSLNCISNETEDREYKLASIYNNAGLNAVKLGDHDLALVYYMKADSILDIKEYQNVRWHVLNNLSILYRLEKRYPEALNIQDRAIEYVDGNQNRLGTLIYNKALVHQNLHNLDSTITLLNGLLSDTLKIEAETENLAWSLLTSSYLELKENEKADVTFKKYLESCTRYDVPVTLDRRKSLEARIWIQEGQLLKARSLLREEIDSVKIYDPENAGLLSSLYKYLNVTYLDGRDFVKGKNTLDETYNVLNAIWEKVNKDDVEKWEKRYALAEKNRAIESQQQELIYQSSRIKQRNILIFLLASMLGLIVFLLRSYRKNNKLLKINNQIIQAEGEKFKAENELLQNKLSDLEHKLDADESILDEFLVLPGGKDRVRLKDIIYVRSVDNGMQFVTTVGNYFKWGALTNLMTLLPDQFFKRSSRSFIVNTTHINAINTKTLTMSNGDTVKLTDKSKLD
jgi:hypothetical protein